MSGSGARAAYGMVQRGVLPGTPRRRCTDPGAGVSAQVAVLPVGKLRAARSVPSAGDRHLVACAVAREIAAAVPGAPPLPPLTVSCSHEHAAWPGTVSTSAVTPARGGLGHRGLAAPLRGWTRWSWSTGTAATTCWATSSRRPPRARQSGWRCSRPPRTGRRRGSGPEWSPSLLTDMRAGEIGDLDSDAAHPEFVRPGHESADFTADDRRHLLTLGMSAYTESASSAVLPWVRRKRERELLASLAESFEPYVAPLTPAPGRQ